VILGKFSSEISKIINDKKMNLNYKYVSDDAIYEFKDIDNKYFSNNLLNYVSNNFKKINIDLASLCLSNNELINIALTLKTERVSLDEDSSINVLLINGFLDEDDDPAISLVSQRKLNPKVEFEQIAIFPYVYKNDQKIVSLQIEINTNLHLLSCTCFVIKSEGKYQEYLYENNINGERKKISDSFEMEYTNQGAILSNVIDSSYFSIRDVIQNFQSLIRFSKTN